MGSRGFLRPKKKKKKDNCRNRSSSSSSIKKQPAPPLANIGAHCFSGSHRQKGGNDESTHNNTVRVAFQAACRWLVEGFEPVRSRGKRT